MSSKIERVEQDPALRFRAWYIFVICTIAMLTIGGQITLQTIFNKSESWAYIINVAGRQRMLSQKITKSALAQNHEELRSSKEEWTRVHAGLLGQNDSLKTIPENSPEILVLYDRIQPHFEGIGISADIILDPASTFEQKQEALEVMASHERAFLPIMNEIVHGYNRLSDSYTASLKRLELIFGGVTLLTLLLEAVFIFEPLIKRFRTSWSALRNERLRFDLAVRGSSDAIFDWDLQQSTLYLAPRFAEIVGVDPSTLTGSPKDLLERICSQYLTRFDEEFNRTVRDPNYSMDIEMRIHHTNGKEIWVLARAAEYRNEHGEAIRLVGSFTDITKLKESQILLRRLSERDSLTGLANRKSFVDLLGLHMQRFNAGEQTDFGVLFLDFDRFKMINDSLGHDIGDGLLQSIAERMTRTLPEEAVVSRFGGDEFAAILPGKDSRDIEDQCVRLLDVLCEPHNVQTHEIRSTASIGLVLSDPRFKNADEMLCDADIAMYQAKNTGRGKVVNFDAAMLDQSMARQVLEGELIKACVTDQMHLVYQPIHDLNSGQIKGFESLIRWEHPTRGLIAPDLFVKLAEECGAINHIGKWIFNSAVQDLQKVVDADPKLTVNVNVSRIQLLQPALLDYTREFAESHPELVRNVILEITETAFMDERVDIVPILQELHRLGYRMAIDDFGTGYSSLSCLHRFPIDLLKIDRSFIKSIEARREFTAVFAAIVSLANSLELDVVAEGVESKNQLIQLQAMDCGYGQGYLFSKPMTLECALEYIRDQGNADQDPVRHAA